MRSNHKSRQAIAGTATGMPEYVDGSFSDEKGYSPKDGGLIAGCAKESS